MRPPWPLVLVLASVVAGCGPHRVAPPPSIAAEPEASDVRPLVVVIHAEWCAACRHSAPAVAWLREEYGDRADFVDLDVTDEARVAHARTTASERGLGRFLDANRDSPGVTILGKNRRTVGHFGAEYRAGPYREAIEQALNSFRATTP